MQCFRHPKPAEQVLHQLVSHGLGHGVAEWVHLRLLGEYVLGRQQVGGPGLGRACQGPDNVDGDHLEGVADHLGAGGVPLVLGPAAGSLAGPAAVADILAWWAKCSCTFWVGALQSKFQGD